MQTTIEPTIITWFPPLGFLGTDEDAREIAKCEYHARRYWQHYKWYDQSEKGKAEKKEYGQSKKGKDAYKRYAQSEKGEACQRRYRQTEKGKTTRAIYQRKYNQTEKGKLYRATYSATPKNRARKTLCQRERRAVKKGIAHWWPRREE